MQDGDILNRLKRIGEERKQEVNFLSVVELSFWATVCQTDRPMLSDPAPPPPKGHSRFGEGDWVSI